MTRCPDNMFEARLDPRIPNSQLVLNSLAPVSDSRANGRRESFLLNFLITKPAKIRPAHIRLPPVAGELLFRPIIPRYFLSLRCATPNSGRRCNISVAFWFPSHRINSPHTPPPMTFSRRGVKGWFESETAPRHCLACGRRPYQKRTKYRQIYRYLRLLTLSNLFIVNSRRVDGDRVKMALYR